MQQFRHRVLKPGVVEVVMVDDLGGTTSLILPEQMPAERKEELLRARAEAGGGQGPVPDFPLKPDQGEAEGGPFEASGAIARALIPVAEAMDPRQIPKIFKAVKEQGIGNVLGSMGEAVVEEQKRPWEKAFEPDRPTASRIGYGAAGLVPFAGGDLSRVGEAFEAGDVATGIGNIIRVLPEVLTRPLGAIKKARAPGPFPTTVGQKTGSGGIGIIESTLGRTVGGFGPFKKVSNAQKEFLAGKVADEIVQNVRSGTRPLDATGVGDDVFKAIQTAKQRMKDELGVSDAFERIDAELASVRGTRQVTTFEPSDVLGPDGLPVQRKVITEVPTVTSSIMPSTASQKRAAQKLLDRMDEQIVGKKLTGAAQDRAALQAIIDGPDRQTFLGMQRDLAALGDAQRKLGVDPGGTGSRGVMLGDLRAETRQELFDSLKRAGRNDLFKDLEDAFEGTRLIAEDLDSRIIQRIAQNEPSLASGLIARASVEELGALRRVLGDELFRDAAAVVLRDEILSPAIIGDELIVSSAGLTGQLLADTGSYVGEITDAIRGMNPGLEINTTRFLNSIQSLDNARGVALFGEEALNGLKEMGKTLRKLGGNKRESLLLGLMLNGAVVYNLVQGDFGVAIPLIAAVRIASTTLATQKGLRTFQNLANAVGSNRVGHILLWNNRLQALMQETLKRQQKEAISSATGVPTIVRPPSGPQIGPNLRQGRPQIGPN